MALLKKVGFGQVEPNRIQGRKQGRVLADIPVNPATVEAMGNKVQNGTVLAVNAGAGFQGNLKTANLDYPTADSTQVGLVYSEVKIYDEFLGMKDFALFTVAPSTHYATQSSIYNRNEEAETTVVPRLLGLTLGDVFTTNLIDVEDVLVLPEEGTELKLNAEEIS